jgi:hypothetical protein
MEKDWRCPHRRKDPPPSRAPESVQQLQWACATLLKRCQGVVFHPLEGQMLLKLQGGSRLRRCGGGDGSLGGRLGDFCAIVGEYGDFA